MICRFDVCFFWLVGIYRYLEYIGLWFFLLWAKLPFEREIGLQIQL